MNGFELLFEGKANNVIPVYKYRSKNTGLTVCICQVEGPIVNGYFCLATEAHDDDGLPHTLEHLIFLGSEQYPFKGVLDLLANRCLASGTNAWTDTDHTCYTMTTAGSEGFLNLMPVYLDHVLYPTLTDNGYITEVHHVNEDGEDAGVVYCEMQARENTGESRTHLEMLRALYPGHCGYKSETGGIMANLRESTSHKKVCDYHNEFYQPENLCLIVTGQVRPEEVFQTLQPFEDKILSKGDRPPYKRPWQSPVPPLEGAVCKTVPYASDDEENGIFLMAWRGPPAKDQYTVTSIMILLEYLTESPVAPLQRDFVEVEDAYCSDVAYSILENQVTGVSINFENVPMEKLSEIKDKLMKLLEDIATGTEQIDMKRMQTVVHRRVLEAMNHLEDNPHDTLAFKAICDFLYGNTTEDLQSRLNQLGNFRKLKEESQTFWMDLIKSTFLGTHSVTIIGEPSQSLMKEMGDKETKRVKEQYKKLGEEGRKKKAEELQNAKEKNEIPPPEDMLTSVDVPDVGSIHFHKIETSNNFDEKSESDVKGGVKGGAPKFNMGDVPVTFQLDNIQTNFVSLSVLMNTENISQDLKPYIPLFLEVILESPVMRDGKLISHSDIINELSADTLENCSSLGVDGSRFHCGAFEQLATLYLKVEVEKYSKAVQWLRELLYQTKLTTDRLKIISIKMMNDVAAMKRKGRRVVNTLMRDMLFKEDSNNHQSSMLRQQKFLTSLMSKLTGDGTQEVLDAMEKVRCILTQPDNIRIHMVASLDALASQGDPVSPWKHFLPEGMAAAKCSKIASCDRAFIKSMENGVGKSMLVGVGSVETTFLIQNTPCISSFNDEDLPALMVYIQYLTQLEGPMWKQIRGQGLSYHYSMYAKPETGLLYFILFKSTHLVNAYKEAKEILDGYLSGKTPMNEVELEAAKSSLIFEIIEEEKTPSEAAEESMLSVFRGISLEYNKNLIKEVAKVTMDDLKRVGPKYLPPLFDPKKSRAAACCHPTRVKEIKKGFTELGREFVDIGPLEESFLARF